MNYDLTIPFENLTSHGTHAKGGFLLCYKTYEAGYYTNIARLEIYDIIRQKSKVVYHAKKMDGANLEHVPDDMFLEKGRSEKLIIYKAYEQKEYLSVTAGPGQNTNTFVVRINWLVKPKELLLVSKAQHRELRKLKAEKTKLENRISDIDNRIEQLA